MSFRFQAPDEDGITFNPSPSSNDVFVFGGASRTSSNSTNAPSISLVPSLNSAPSCANCGKREEEEQKLKKCSACQSVKYCCVECQIAHRPQHKKACKKIVAELYEERLFNDVESEDCPICMVPLPCVEDDENTFKSCCGQIICDGCIYAMHLDACEKGVEDCCAFCRTPLTTSMEIGTIRLKKLMAAGNPHAFNKVATCYFLGSLGFPQDAVKANELYFKAGELGSAEAYTNLACNYEMGRGVEIDFKKAKHYYELAAMNGCIQARRQLGGIETQNGNVTRGMKHFLIAARAGDKTSLDTVQASYPLGWVTKDDYANALRGYQKRRDDVKSEQRDKARKAERLFGDWKD